MKAKIRTFTGTTDPAVQPFESAHRALARRAAAESIVLLKNEGNVLPIPVDTPIALYGAGAGRTMKGGTGSGDVNERYSVTLVQGLENAGYTITSREWIDDYDTRYTAAREAWRDRIWQGWAAAGEDLNAKFFCYAENPFRVPAVGLPITKTPAEVALYVISRVAGEGADRLAEPGDYFLSDAENDYIDRLCALYPRVVLVLNTGGQVDLSVLDRYSNIVAVVQMSQLGCEGGNAFGDVLSGKVTPGGKLSATWARDYMDYPNSATFSHNNGDVEREYYHEGIYVGYRFFDTFRVPVRYGFGYGLSYTTFDIALTALTTQRGRDGNPEICLSAGVKNTGTCPGKEVVQVYVACPQGSLQKERRRLVAFGKTGELVPGQEETLTLTFSMEDCSSYHQELPGWFLEAGAYGIFVGNSLEASAYVGAVTVQDAVILTHTRNICPLQQELEELTAPVEELCRWTESWQACLTEKPMVTLRGEDFLPRRVVYGEEPEKIAPEVRAFVEGLTTDQLILLATGDPGQAQGSHLGSSGISVPGSAAQTSICARHQGLADIVMADGPAGLRLQKSYQVKDGSIVPVPFEQNLEGGYLVKAPTPQGDRTYYQYCTAFPVGTALAQSWDLSLMTQVGQVMAEEMQQHLVTSWLAPGMNLQRNPLCGRNFEYFSEDPLLTGKLAAAITRGVQTGTGCGTTIKHFACNNQEDNRMGSDSILSERTLRELYLKGFEIAVKQSQPLFIMTSYNLINGVHAANNYDICTAAARDEWGFQGVIMTDWTTTEHGPDCTAAGCMRAGNDLVMPGVPADHENLHRELAAGTLTLEELKTAICHLVTVIWKSNMYS